LQSRKPVACSTPLGVIVGFAVPLPPAGCWWSGRGGASSAGRPPRRGRADGIGRLARRVDPLRLRRADGAEWIWNAVAAQFPAAAQVPDIFHACEHLAATAAALFGGGAAAWVDRGRRSLLADGWPGLLDHIGTTPTEGRSAAGQASLDGLISYFAKHTGRLGYYGRLRTGRSIGSGGVEGLARRMGRRLKVPGRGWCVEHLEGMAALIATTDTTEWENLWSRPAA
jgi:hypothetical protein